MDNICNLPKSEGLSTSGYQESTVTVSNFKNVPGKRNRKTGSELLLARQIYSLKKESIKTNTFININKKHLSTKQKLRLLLKKSNLKCLNNVNQNTLKLLNWRTKNQSKERGFSTNEQIFALLVSQQIGKGYGFVSKYFDLPSHKTLCSLLGKIPLTCGINEDIFLHLTNVVRKMKKVDRYCVLLFDQISLSTGISYNNASDCFDGFVDLGEADRKPIFADRALVFMIKGVRKNWKQPISFYFCEHKITTMDLVMRIKKVIRNVRKTGLRVVATICDQGVPNNSAIKHLLNETNSYCLENNITNKFQGYLIDNVEIVHLFDYPHLLKSFRNSFLTKDLQFQEDGVNKVASWSHVVALYLQEKNRGTIQKLTDQHVLPQKICKRKVKNCTQVFSHKVAAVMNLLAMISKRLLQSSSYYLDPSASQTAHLLKFFDNIVDSLNGTSLKPPIGKKLLCVVTSKSGHTKFWQNSLSIFKSMLFITSSGPIITSSLRNWEFTLRGFIYIWNKLNSKGFRFMSPRAFNQDPLENLFDQIRRHGGRNTRPTCSSFISSTKSLLLNNFLSPHLPNSNCERDNDRALDTLKCLIKKEMPVNNEIKNIPMLTVMAKQETKLQKTIATACMAGVVLKKLLKKNTCKTCANKLTTNQDLPHNLLVRKKQYKLNTLCAPSQIFLECFDEISLQIFKILPEIVHLTNLKKIILKNVDNCLGEKMFCSNHIQFSKLFTGTLIQVCLLHYAKIINNLLNKKDTSYKNMDKICKIAYKKSINKVK